MSTKRNGKPNQWLATPAWPIWATEVKTRPPPIEKKEYSNMKTNPKRTRAYQVAPKATAPPPSVVAVVTQAQPATSGDRKERS